MQLTRNYRFTTVQRYCLPYAQRECASRCVVYPSSALTNMYMSPTWVPDWSQRSHLTSIISRDLNVRPGSAEFCATGSSTYTWKPPSNPSQLRVHGHVTDQIQAIGDALPSASDLPFGVDVQTLILPCLVREARSGELGGFCGHSSEE